MVQSYRRMPSEFRQDVDGGQQDLTNLESLGTDEGTFNNQLTIPSVATANDLPADSELPTPSYVFVEDEERVYRY